MPLAGLVLLLAYYLGPRASILYLVVLSAVIGGVALLRQPVLGLALLILTALLLPIQFSTGTEVPINLTTVVAAALIGLWLLLQVRQKHIALPQSSTTLPLLLFLLAGLLSLFIGNVTWDPAVPRANNFIFVQLAQWAIFLLSAAVFWAVPAFVKDQAWLRRLTFLFLGISGFFILALVLGGGGNPLTRPVFGSGLFRSMFWPIFFALAAGQLLFNKELTTTWRLFLLAGILATVVYLFGERAAQSASPWVGVGVVLGMLIWLRFSRLRWPVFLIGVGLLVSGVAFPAIYEFAGGDTRWFSTGGSRIALIERTLEVTMRNPVTGLGPASYRQYAAMSPLIYEHIVWFDPRVSSHNNYVDVFSQMGIIGLSLFIWFMVALGLLGWKLRRHYQTGFAAGYVNGILALWAAILVMMMIADWFLPFVYNQHFVGFQASIMAWLFLGGLLALEHWKNQECNPTETS